MGRVGDAQHSGTGSFNWPTPTLWCSPAVPTPRPALFPHTSSHPSLSSHPSSLLPLSPLFPLQSLSSCFSFSFSTPHPPPLSSLLPSLTFLFLSFLFSPLFFLSSHSLFPFLFTLTSFPLVVLGIEPRASHVQAK